MTTPPARPTAKPVECHDCGKELRATLAYRKIVGPYRERRVVYVCYAHRVKGDY
jgi:hypothetical protein